MNLNPVLCTDTGEIFESIKDAAKWNGCTTSYIRGHLAGHHPHAMHKHFRYLATDELIKYLKDKS
jgi:hypothetical protein